MNDRHGCLQSKNPVSVLDSGRGSSLAGNPKQNTFHLQHRQLYRHQLVPSQPLHPASSPQAVPPQVPAAGDQVQHSPNLLNQLQRWVMMLAPVETDDASHLHGVPAGPGGDSHS